MTQTNNQVVNVIVNQATHKKRKRRTPSQKQPNFLTGSSTTTTNPQNTAYNPNSLTVSRPPEYGLRSVNPILTDHPLLLNIADSLKNNTTNMDTYKQEITDNLQKTVFDTVNKDLQDVIDKTLQSKGNGYLNNYFANNSVVSRANSIMSPEDNNMQPLVLKQPKKLLRFKKPIGRPPIGGHSQESILEHNINLVKQKIDDLTLNNPNNKRQLTKFNNQLQELLLQRDSNMPVEPIQTLKSRKSKKND